MFNLFKKKDPIEELWSWFEENRASYEKLDDEKIGDNLDPIYQRVANISGGLAIEVAREANGVRELVVSANGDVKLFPLVEQIVERAPKFERWTITAFRPRLVQALVLEAGDLKLDASKMFFVPFEDEGELQIGIFAENIKGKDEKKVFGFGMILIDNLLGEYDSVMKVKAFQFCDIEDAPEDWPLQPLIELPDVVDEFHRKTNN